MEAACVCDCRFHLNEYSYHAKWQMVSVKKKIDTSVTHSHYFQPNLSIRQSIVGWLLAVNCWHSWLSSQNNNVHKIWGNYMKTLPGQMQTSQILLGWPQSFWVDLSFCGQIGQLCRIWRDHMEKFLDDWDDRSNWRLSQKSSLLFLNGWGNRDERYTYWNQALTVTEDAPVFTCYASTFKLLCTSYYF